MEKLEFKITIAADKRRVWETMLDAEKYEIWVKAFSDGSTFIGEWKEGTEIKFFDPNMGGTIARLDIFKPHDLIEATHIATLTKDQVRETTGPMTEKWIGSREIYRFTENSGSTDLAIEMETDPEFVDMFNECWPKALENIKQLVES